MATKAKVNSTMRKALTSWVALNKDINKFDEKELRLMLKYELHHEERSAVIRRIKQKIIGVHVKEFKEKLDKLWCD